LAEKPANLSRSAGIVSLGSAISRVTGLVNILVVAKALEYGRFQDSYNLANVMPNMLFELLAGGILTSLFIPIFIERRLRNEADSRRVAANIMNITVLFLVGMALLGTVFSYQLVRLQTFLVPTKTVSIADLDFFFKFFVWQIVFYGLATIMNGILQAHRRFTVPAFAPILNNVVAIVTILVFYLPLRDTNPKAALVVLAFGTTLGVVAMALVQVPALLRVGWRWQPVLDFKDPAIKNLAILSVPILGYVASNQIGLTVANALAWKFEGGLTAFQYAWRFFQMPYGLLAVTVSTVLFPGFSEQAASSNTTGFKRSLLLAVSATAFIIIPASVLLFLLSQPTINLIFGSGLFGFLPAWDGAAVEQTAGVMAYFMVGLLPFSLYMLLTRVFYAMKDTVTPMKINAIGVPLNIGLSFALVGQLGVAGLSLAHSLTYLFTMGLLFLALKKRIGGLNGRLMLKNTVKFATVSVGMAAVILALAGWFKTSGLPVITADAATVLTATAAGTTVYLVLSRVLGADEVGLMAGIFRGILRGKRPVAAIEANANEQEEI
jgi:putative peptidoglycan lipid II flippase